MRSFLFLSALWSVRSAVFADCMGAADYFYAQVLSGSSDPQQFHIVTKQEVELFAKILLEVGALFLLVLPSYKRIWLKRKEGEQK